MKCFYRNETLHKSDPVGATQNHKPLSRKELAWGTAYAKHHLEGRNSLFGGFDNVYSNSRSHPDCERADRSRLWRLQPPDQSSFIQCRTSSADAKNSILIRDADERHQGSRGEMGTSTLARRADRFSSHRSGRRYVLASGGGKMSRGRNRLHSRFGAGISMASTLSRRPDVRSHSATLSLHPHLELR
jgi:hypothetical protein